MKKIFKTILIYALGVALITSCASSGFGPYGLFYTGHKLGVYGTSPSGSKTGKACAMSIVGLLSMGDASVEKATQNAGIYKVNNINLESFSVLGLYGELCTVVQGD